VQYIRVESVPAALDAIHDSKAHVIAGGTDLLVKMRGGLIRPEILIDISDIADLRGINASDTFIEIGAATPQAEIRMNPVVCERLPLLAEVLGALGSPQIRNRGTLGGNLVNASPAADSAIPLLLYDAQVLVLSPSGERETPLSQFFAGPGRTTLSPGELVKAIRIPLLEGDWSSFFHKVGKRRALTISIASVGALLQIENAQIVEARLAAGSVAPTPLRLTELEGELRGVRLDEQTIEEAVRKGSSAVSPISDVRASAEYRSQVVGELIGRALREAIT